MVLFGYAKKQAARPGKLIVAAPRHDMHVTTEQEEQNRLL